MINGRPIGASAVNAAPARPALHAASAHAGYGLRADAYARMGLECRAQAGYGYGAGAAAHRRLACSAAAAYGCAAGCGGAANLLRAALRYGLGADAWGVLLGGDFFGWAEGVGYRVVRADQAVGGLEQGGIKRDALMGSIQRMGL
jgi:hypothetical protein